MLNDENTNDVHDEKPESELLKAQREKYEKIIADKNKIIVDLLNGNSLENKVNKKDDNDVNEDDEKEKEKQAQQKRLERYKKLIF